MESAGTKATSVRPEAVAVMRELGIDISHHRSKNVEEVAAGHFDYVLTVCDNARESCPIFPAATLTGGGVISIEVGVCAGAFSAK